MISDFFEGRALTLQESESETRRFGFTVTRATVPLGDAVSDDDVVAAVNSSASDIVIVRFDARRKTLGPLLRRTPGVDCIHADTLVYYEWNLRHLQPTAAHQTNPTITRSKSFDDIAGVLRESFKDYRNHYSSNPRLAASVTVTAYEEWASNLMRNEMSRVLVARDETNGEVTGFVLLTVAESERIAEVVLNAVRPAAQRGGVYSALMRAAAGQLASLRSIDRLYISTQSENLAVIAAWKKLGLEPFLALETHHVMRRKY